MALLNAIDFNPSAVEDAAPLLYLISLTRLNRVSEGMKRPLTIDCSRVEYLAANKGREGEVDGERANHVGALQSPT